jgi:predicted ATPase
MFFEDAHWADATSLELLDLTVERVRQLPVLALFTFRPEFEPPWVGLSNVSTLTLGRLDRANVGAMIVRVTGGRLLPTEVMEQIVAKTDGNPLFVEELTKAVLEAGILVEDAGGYRLDGPLPPLAIPATLQDSLMARLDRLAPVKEIGQIGAAIGREFSYSLLRALVGRDEARLNDALARFEEAELLFRRGEPPDAIYSFKHALVQDAAYESLLKSRRQVLHRRIAEALRDRFPTVAETQPEVVAHHFTQAGLTEAAVEWWGKAGERAVRRAANREAIEHFRRALSLNETQPGSMGRSRTELAILSQLGPALMNVHGWSAPEAGAVFHRAGEVAQRLERSVGLAPPLVGLWLFHQARAQFTRAEEISGELFGIARELNDPEVLLQAHHATWPTRFVRGLLADAAEHIDAGMALYDEARHERHKYIYMGHDPAVCALAVGAPVQWLLGRPERAIHLEHQAVELARRLRHAPSLAHALWFACESQIVRGDTAAVTVMATELLTLCEEQRLPQPRAAALMFLGWGLGRTGNVAEGTCLLEEGLGAWNRLGVRCYLPGWMCLLAENHLTAQRYAEGLVQVRQALAVAAESGEQWFVPRMHQVCAELLLHMQDGTDESPEAILRTAIDIACGQGAKGWELRATVALARLWAEGGERWKAHDLLAPVLACFTEGLDTAALKGAKELLETLS